MSALMAVTVKIPTQLRSVTGGEGETTVEGATTVGEVLDGLYDRFGTPDVVLGQHVAPFPVGMVFHRPGAVMAASKAIDVTIFGRGGHGSRPETAVDPVVVGSFVVARLQTIVAREVDPSIRRW